MRFVPLVLFSFVGVAIASSGAAQSDFLAHIVAMASSAIHPGDFLGRAARYRSAKHIPEEDVPFSSDVADQDSLPPEYAEAHPEQMHTHSNIGANGPSDVADDSISHAQDNELLQRWLSWEFWSLLIICSGVILFFSEVVSPLLECCIGKDSFLIDSTIFLIQMMCFMLAAAYFSHDRAAGHKNTISLATLLAALALLNLLFALSMCLQTVETQVQAVMDDIGDIFQPLARLVVVFLVIHGVLEESGSNWDSLIVLGSFLALGIAFAAGGIMKDLMSYIFIRCDDYFKEGDFIYFQGEICQVRAVTWLFTIAYKIGTRSTMFVPNNLIGMGGCNNQSKDDARLVETTIPLPGEMTGETMEAIVEEAWSVLRNLKESGFTALNGETYECQMDVSRTAMYIESIATSVGLPQFCTVHLHLRLFGKYYFSYPPPWTGEGEEPPLEQRQMAWKMLWHYQVEWFLLQVKKAIEKHAGK